MDISTIHVVLHEIPVGFRTAIPSAARCRDTMTEDSSTRHLFYSPLPIPKDYLRDAAKQLAAEIDHQIMNSYFEQLLAPSFGCPPVTPKPPKVFSAYFCRPSKSDPGQWTVMQRCPGETHFRLFCRARDQASAQRIVNAMVLVEQMS